MKRIATIFNDAGEVIGLVHGPDAQDQSVTVNGRVWRFDFHDYCGPMWLRADGEPRKCQCPKSPLVWAAFGKWLEDYRKIKTT